MNRRKFLKFIGLTTLTPVLFTEKNNNTTNRWIKLKDEIPEVGQEVFLVEIEKDTKGLIRIFSVCCGKRIEKSEEYTKWYAERHSIKEKLFLFIKEKWGYHEQFENPFCGDPIRKKKYLKYSSITCLHDIYTKKQMNQMADKLRGYEWVNDKAKLSVRFGPKYNWSENIHAVTADKIIGVMSISLETGNVIPWHNVDIGKEVYWISFTGKIPKSVPTYKITDDLDMNFIGKN